MTETTSVVGTDTNYPATITTDGNRVTSMTFACQPHANPVPCAPCDTAEVAYVATRPANFVAYVTAHHVVTLGGAPLARVTQLYLARRRYTPTGGTYRLAYVQAVTPDGTYYHGSYNDDGGELITLRRSKRQ
jgi:hypothetical protein